MREKILIITGDGGESYETLYARHRFEEAGYAALIAAQGKRTLNLVMHDFLPGWDTYAEMKGYQAAADLTFDEVEVDDYAAVLLIGGRAPEYLRNNRKVVDLVRAFDEKGKWVLAICHGIQIFLATGRAAGRRMTCYEHVRFEVESNGGRFDRAGTVRDGNLITAATWMDHPGFYREIFRALEAREPEPVLKNSRQN